MNEDRQSSSPKGRVEYLDSARDALMHLPYEDLQKIFHTLDKNNDGYVTNAEFIHGLKKSAWIADKLGKFLF